MHKSSKAKTSSPQAKAQADQLKSNPEKLPVEEVDEEEEPSEIDSFLLDQDEIDTEEDNSVDDLDEDEDDSDEDSEVVSEEKAEELQKAFLLGVEVSQILTKRLTGANPDKDCPSVDPETQKRLEALLEAAGIGKLTGDDSKQLTDPEVLKHLTSSVSCALDEAAAALTRMRADPPQDGRSLVEACNEGDISKVRQLLDEGRVSVHDTTEEGESLLSLACSAGYFELAQVLLAMRANVEDRGTKGDCTPLMEAASAGHVDIVKLLLAHGADVNAESSSGHTPLMWACAQGHEAVVTALLEGGAKVEAHNENGHTPLMEAASAGHVGVAKILLKYGAGINTHSNEFKESALTLACYKGHLEMVRFLLEAGADQEHKTDEMHTALMEASMDGHVEVAKLLLDSGAQVNMPADSFESPLTLAACGGHVELALLLLERGAHIEEVNDEGYTPLMEASREGHEEMVALLLSQGADINAQTEETQETALTLACCGGFLEVADFLIKAGADIELGASTPLMEAAQEGHLDLVKYLLKAGAQVNAVTGTGDTALTYASENGHTEVVELLLKYNATLEHESEGGRTPLMKAARAGHLSTVKFLISQGASVNKATANNDHTSLSLACAGGHQVVVEVLLQHGADPYHKLKDNSTMLIEAAKGGYTNVVQILIDYPNNLALGQPAVVDPSTSTSSDQGNESNGNNSTSKAAAMKSVLRKTKAQTQPSAAQSDKNAEGSVSKCAKSSTAGATEAGFDFIESSGSYVIEGLADKGLDAKTYIESVLSRTEGSSKEEQIQEKERILAELQSVERELQEKAQAQINSSAGESSGKESTNEDPIEKPLAALSLDEATSPGKNNGSGSSANANVTQASPPSMLSQRALASMPVSERPKAKPSRKIDGKGGKKNQLHAAAPQQHIHQLAQLQQLHQLNQQLQKQVLQQRQLKQQNEATLAALQQNAIANQQQLAALQQNVAQLQQLEQHILQQQQMQQQNNNSNSNNSSNNNQQQSNNNQQQHQQLQLRVQQILQQKQQLQQKIIQFQQEVEQQLAYTQHTTAVAASQQAASSATGKASNKRSKESDDKAKKKANEESSQAAYELVQASTALQAAQALKNLDGNGAPADIEPLAQDPSLLTTMDPMQLADAIQNCKMIDISSPAFLSGYKDGLRLQAAAAGSLHASAAGSQPVQYPFISGGSPGSAGASSSGSGGSASGTGESDPNFVSNFSQQLILQSSHFLFGQSGNGGDMPNPMNYPNSELMNPTFPLGPNSELYLEQPDLPQPLVEPSTVTKSKKAKTSKKGRDKLGQEDSLPTLDNAAAASVTAAPIGNSMVDLDSETESNHDTALTLACAGGHDDLVTLLLNKGSDIEHRDKKGFTPLILAATAGHEKVVEILLKHNADIEAQSERTKDTPLSLACSGGRYEVAELLLAHNANKEHRNVSDYTPLSLAASGGYVSIIKLLLANGAEINSRTGSKLGISPLMLAAMNGHTAAVRLLLDMGSDINAQIETNRNTALTLACFQGRHEVVSLLLDRKANVEHRAKTGLTPLMEAASGGYVEVGRVLLDKGADVNAPPVPSSRDTALTIAADKGHYRFVELLLSRGAQVDVRNKKGNSSLWLAANGGHLDVVQLLYSAGADIDSQDNRKVSCLMAAFRKGHCKVVKWMVKHVTQFPSDTELTRYIATINAADKDTLKKCQQCMEIVRIAKDRQAAEAAKNASSLLEELDRESKAEQSKREAAARKREKKKRKKMEKMGKTKEVEEKKEEEEDDDNSDDANNSDDEKEKSPDPNEIENVAPSNVLNDTKNNQETSQANKNKKKKNKNNKKNEEESTAKIKEPEETKKTEVHTVATTNGPDSALRAGTSNAKTPVITRKANNSSPINTNTNPTTPRKNVATSRSQTQTSSAVPVEAAGWKEVVRKSKKVSVPANAISRVIGRGGCNINAIRELSGAHIEVEKQGKGGGDRTIVIKGSAEATRQANMWIQGIITSPEKEISEIIGKQYKLLQQPVGAAKTAIPATSVAPAKAAIPAVASKAPGTVPAKAATPTMAKMSGDVKKTTVTNNSVSMAKPLANNGFNTTTSVKTVKGGSFAAVAGGGTDAVIGQKPVPGVLPGPTAAVNARPKSSKDMSDSHFNNDQSDFTTFTPSSSASSSSVPLSQAPHQQAAAPGLQDNKSYSPFKYNVNVNWGGSQQLESGSQDIFSNMGGASSFKMESDVKKAPGYRGGANTSSPVNTSTLTNIGTWGNMPATTMHSTTTKSPIHQPRTSESQSLFQQSSQERCNSAPGTPLSPAIPAPIGPPQVAFGKSPTPATSTFSPPGREPDQFRQPVGYGRSMTPDGELDSLRPISSGGLVPNSNRPSSVAGVEKRASGSGMMDGGSSSFYPDVNLGPSNDGSEINEKVLMNTAAQLAAVGSFQEFGQLTELPNSQGFNSIMSNQRFNPPPPTSTADLFTSKLTPGSQDYSRFGQDFMSANPVSSRIQQQVTTSSLMVGSAKPGLNHYTNANRSSGNSNMYANSFGNRDMMMGGPQAMGYGSALGSSTGQVSSSQQDFDLGSLSGRSLMEIMGATDLTNFNMASAFTGGQSAMGVEVEPKFSRPIGAERGNRAAPPQSNINISSTPWETSGSMYRDNSDLTNGLGGFNSGYHGQSMMGFNNGTNVDTMFMSSNASPNKECPDYIHPGNMTRPGAKKLGLMERGDPSAVKKSMAPTMWNKKWEG